MLILDGYNVLHSYFGGRTEYTEVQREEFLRLLEDYTVARDRNALVFFDGGQGGLPYPVRRQIVRGHLTVVTTPAGVTADEAILEHAQAVQDRRSIRIVTSDRYILHEAERLGVQALTSEEFVRELETFRREGPPTYRSRKESGISEGEAEYWMREFGIDRNEPRFPLPETGQPARTGTYTCPKSGRAHRWHIDRWHILHWNGEPYIPVAGPRSHPNHPPEITDFLIRADEDRILEGGALEEYLRGLDRDTDEITGTGRTYILLVAWPPVPEDARWMFDEKRVAGIVQGWEKLAPRVCKDGLRAVCLFGTIDREFSWPGPHGPDAYGEALGRVADRARSVFGGAPVFYRAGAGGGFANVFAGARAADGFGFVLFPRSVSAAGFDPVPRKELESAVRAASSATDLGLLWVAEFGKSSGLPQGQVRGALDCGTAFSSKKELRAHLVQYIGAGFTGFVRAAFGRAPEADRRRDYGWYAELKPWIREQVLRRAAG